MNALFDTKAKRFAAESSSPFELVQSTISKLPGALPSASDSRISVRRWEDFTGKQAALESDGRGFDQLASARIATDSQKKR